MVRDFGGMKMQIRELIKDLKIRNRLNDYPCSDLLHNALRFIRKGSPNVAYGEICCAIIRSGGELTEEEREYLKEKVV